MTDVTERLFATTSTTRDRFLETYPWRAVEVHGDPTRLGELFSLGLWDDPLGMIRQSPDGRLPTVYSVDPPSGRSTQASADPGAAAAAYVAGSSVAIEEGDRLHPEIERWSLALARELGLRPDGCKALVVASPAGPAVPLHLDGIEVLVVQLRGRKRWRYAANERVAFADRGYFREERGGGVRGDSPPLYDPRSLEGEVPALVETVLHPGSALFLPRGFWHATDCDDASVSISFRLRNRSAYHVVADAIARRLASRAEWRRPLPGVEGSAAWRRSALRQLDALVPRLVDDLDLGDLGEPGRWLLGDGASARLQRSPGHDLRVREAEGDLVVVKDGRPIRRLGLRDRDLAAFARWIAAQESPFHELDALHAADRCSEEAATSLLRWLIQAGALATSEPIAGERTAATLQAS